MNYPQPQSFPLVMHPDQTNKQPVVWACLNPECAPTGRRDFVFESEYPTCPKCGASGYPFVQKRVLVHWIIPDPMGAIQGQFRRYRMACDKTRELLATPTNGEVVTNNKALVNCPGCLKDEGSLSAHEAGDSITAENVEKLLAK